MEANKKRQSLALITLLIGAFIIINTAIDFQHTAIYAVIGVVGLALAHWFFREKAPQNYKFFAFVVLATVCFSVLNYFKIVNLNSNPESSSTFELLSFIPLAILFIAILVVYLRYYRAKKAL